MIRFVGGRSGGDGDGSELGTLALIRRGLVHGRLIVRARGLGLGIRGVLGSFVRKTGARGRRACVGCCIVLGSDRSGHGAGGDGHANARAACDRVVGVRDPNIDGAVSDGGGRVVGARVASGPGGGRGAYVGRGVGHGWNTGVSVGEGGRLRGLAPQI